METPYEAGRGYELTQVRVDQFRHDAPCQGEATAAPGVIAALLSWLPGRQRAHALAGNPDVRVVDSAVARG